MPKVTESKVTKRPPRRPGVRRKDVPCKACGGSGKNSYGGPCYPCEGIGRLVEREEP